MLIGKWADKNNYSKTKQENLFQNCKYHLNINGIEINLNQLNEYVLECELPKFESMFVDHVDHDDNNNNNTYYSNNKSDADNSSYSCINGQSFIYKTQLYLYENEDLYCAPIPFEIKFNSIKSNQTNSFKSNLSLS